MLKGQWAQALPMLQRLTGKAGPIGDLLLADCLLRTGKTAQAYFFAERAAESAPRDAEVRRRAARVFSEGGLFDRAVTEYQKAAELDPTSEVPAVCTSGIRYLQGRRTEALEICRAGFQRFPNHPELSVHAAACLQDLGRHDEAFRILQAARQANPLHMSLRSAACMATCYDSDLTTQQVFDEHAAFGRTLTELQPPKPVIYKGSKDPNRPLRVGFVSPDTKSHAVAYFLEPLLEHLDRSQFTTVVFSTTRVVDDTTKRLKTAAREWHAASEDTPIELAQRILAADIDILIDLAGHTGGNSLVAFHLRPAPIQATYLGYPNTTGMTTIDARIVDEVTDPPACDALATEKLVRLPAPFLCYRPPAEAPPIADLPPGPPVFGSFNNLHKLSNATITLWAKLLARVPDAKLLLKARGLGDLEIDRSLRDRFAAASIHPSRLELLPGIKGVAEHLSTYARVCVGLDTTPYSGTTTTCEALWMGVPVVTLAGETHVSRVGASLLATVGHSELIATNHDAYIDTAASLIADQAKLASLRRSLREGVAKSQLCNGPDFAARFGTALRELWRTACSVS